MDDPVMSDAEDRRWYLVRGVPVALIITLLGTFGTQTGVAVWYFAQQNAEQKYQSSRLTTVETKLDGLISSVQSGTVPNALNAARITNVERAQDELRTRLNDIERRVPR